MQLAREFAPWMAQLQRFPEEVALGLSPMLRQLWAALGGSRSRGLTEGDPDGISGISQRGSFERLLASEWLLAAEIPTEFLRRAAMKELLFLDSARRRPAGSRRCILIFDAGPSQLGSPRLAHIALLLVFERRVTEAGGSLQWLVAQEPERLFSTVEPSFVTALLASRSCREPMTEDIEKIQQHLGALNPGDELVWIGGGELHRLAKALGGQQICIFDPLEAENDRLLVRLSARDRAHECRELSLVLPPPAIRTRLIRHPFADSTALFPPLDIGAGPFRFSQDGRKVLTLQGNRVEVHLPIRNAQYRTKVLELPVSSRLVGYGWHDKSIIALGESPTGYVLNWSSELLTVRFVQRRFVAGPRDGCCSLITMGRNRPRILLLDAEGTLFVGVKESRDFIEFTPFMDRIRELRWRRGHVAYVRTQARDHLELGTISAALDLTAKSYGIHSTGAVPAYDRQQQTGGFAVRISSDTSDEGTDAQGTGGLWQVFTTQGEAERIELGRFDRALACVPRQTWPEPHSGNASSNDSKWALIVDSREDGALHAVCRDGRRKLLHPPLMESVPLWDENFGRLLYRTPAGTLQVVDLLLRRVEPQAISVQGAPS
ncbi:MAG: hypothetical protein QM784_33555 [Polyangiaceae bacterium]